MKRIKTHNLSYYIKKSLLSAQRDTQDATQKSHLLTVRHVSLCSKTHRFINLVNQLRWLIYMLKTKAHPNCSMNTSFSRRQPLAFTVSFDLCIFEPPLESLYGALRQPFVKNLSNQAWFVSFRLRFFPYELLRMH